MSDGARREVPSFAVIVPMYNERAGAERCVREIAKVLSTVPNRTSLIVVDDGSTDGTGTILADLLGQHPVLDVVPHGTNRGYGAAVVTGAARAASTGFEYTLFMDSDLTNDPRDIPRFAARMHDGVDVIKATRYSLGGSVRGVPFYRMAISALGNRIARVLFRLPIHDCTNGFRAVRCRLLTRDATDRARVRGHHGRALLVPLHDDELRPDSCRADESRERPAADVVRVSSRGVLALLEISAARVHWQAPTWHSSG